MLGWFPEVLRASRKPRNSVYPFFAREDQAPSNWREERERWQEASEGASELQMPLINVKHPTSYEALY